MQGSGICHRCHKPVGIDNQVIVHGKLFGTICAHDIKKLIKLRSRNSDLQNLCKGSFCIDCKRTFNCPLKSAVENGIVQLEMF